MMTASDARVTIDGRPIGGDAPAFIVAEVAQSHDGSLGQAHAFIDAAAEAGADAIKFQTHIAAAESTYDEPFRVRFSRQDETRFDYWKRMEFTPEQWAGLAAHARERGLVFLSSAFSLAAVEILEALDMPAWKIGSGEFRSWTLVEAMIATGKPILLSTGMSRHAEIDEAVAVLARHGAPFALLQCTSAYPTPLERVGLNVMADLAARHGCPVGLSDHSGTPYPALAAMARGAALIELHVAFDRAMFGPDVPASVTFGELRGLAEARDAFSVMDANPVDKDAMAAELEALRGAFTKSLAPVRRLPAGTVLDADMLTLKKPGSGLSAERLDNVVGRRLARDVAPEHLLKEDDLE